MEIMYEVPSRTDVQAVLVNGDTVRNHEKPRYVLLNDAITDGGEIAPVIQA